MGDTKKKKKPAAKPAPTKAKPSQAKSQAKAKPSAPASGFARRAAQTLQKPNTKSSPKSQKQNLQLGGNSTTKFPTGPAPRTPLGGPNAQIGPPRDHPGKAQEDYAAYAYGGGAVGELKVVSRLAAMEAEAAAAARMRAARGMPPVPPPRMEPGRVRSPHTPEQVNMMNYERAQRTAQYDQQLGVPQKQYSAPTFDEYIGPATRAAKNALSRKAAKAPAKAASKAPSRVETGTIDFGTKKGKQ